MLIDHFLQWSQGRIRCTMGRGQKDFYHFFLLPACYLLLNEKVTWERVRWEAVLWLCDPFSLSSQSWLLSYFSLPQFCCYSPISQCFLSPLALLHSYISPIHPIPPTQKPFLLYCAVPGEPRVEAAGSMCRKMSLITWFCRFCSLIKGLNSLLYTYSFCCLKPMCCKDCWTS